MPLWRSETCYSGQIIESETLSSIRTNFIISSSSVIIIFCPLLSFIVHNCYLSSFIVIDQFLLFVDIQLSFELSILTILVRRERQSVSLILGEENPFKVRGTKMASGYDTPPGGVHIVQISRQSVVVYISANTISDFNNWRSELLGGRLQRRRIFYSSGASIPWQSNTCCKWPRPGGWTW